jgi:LacI family transcriptional regulator, galactose operon repressor
MRDSLPKTFLEMTEQRVTITELARASGVSVGTVSRALNGYTDVRPETRERIMRLARELDYTPGAAARSLVTQRSHVIGVVLDTGEGHPDLQHPFFHEVLVGIKNEIGASGFDLLLFASERPGNGYGPHSYLKRCRHHNVDGVVLMGVDAQDPEVQRVVRSELPAVGVDVELTGPRTTYAMSDNVDGAVLAVRHLHAAGHRRIATITGLLGTRPGADRLGGYRRAIQELGLAYRDEYVAYGDFYTDSGRQAMERLIALPEPPTAIFAASDMMALGAIRAASQAGLSVPRDVSVVGFDDIQLADHMNPPLSTLRQDKAGLGRAAGAALVRIVEKGATEEGTVVLPVELIERGSSGPAPTAGAGAPPSRAA